MPDDAFVDLEIRIGQRVPDGYPIEITLDGQQEFPRGYLSPEVLPWAMSGDLVADGQRLFNHLLTDPKVREAWAQAHGQSAQRRIRLRIDPTGAELHALPWELLHDGTSLLAAHADTPFSRYLPIALPWRSPINQRPIKVLIVISNPDDLTSKYDLPQADVALEEEILEAAFKSIERQTMQIDFLDEPITLERLEEKLRQGYHLLHFLGHGAFNARREQAVLYLQDEDRHARRVLDEDFVGMLARQGVQPRLVCLAACQSATRSTADAYLGLGPKLVSAGVPAVVAMQDAVTVKTARQFSAAFYQRLVEHGQVDRAMNEARSTLITAGRPDAAVPVLFMRLKSGRLWGEEPVGADSRSALPEILPPPEPEHPPIVQPFIGREAELARYQQQLDTHHLAVISGMPGIGKTVLAAELAQRSAGTRAIFWHTFQENEGLTAILWKLAAFLAWHGRPEVWRVMQTGGQAPLARLLLDYVVQVLRDRDNVVCLDDAQLVAGDPLLELLIDHLRRLASSGGLRLIIATQDMPDFVDGDEFPPLSGFMLLDARSFLIQHGLSVAATAEARVAGEAQAAEVRNTQALRRTQILLPEEIVATLHARTGGNPLFLLLAADGLKRAKHTGGYLAQLFDDRDIRRFLIHQIDRRLTEPERGVMQALSVMLGYGATREAIEAVSDGLQTGRILDELSDRQLVAVKDTEAAREYALNTIVRTFYCDQLNPRERQRGHQRAAEHYEQAEPDRFRAALHYEAAGQPDHAAPLVVDNVGELIKRGQGRGLGQLLERFTADRLLPDLWATVNLARGEVHTVQGNSETARRSFQAALMTLDERYDETAASPDVRRLYARAYLGIGALLENEDPPEARTWLQRGLRVMPEEAVLHIRLGSVQLAMGNYAEALSSTERGLQGLTTWLDHWRAVAWMNLGVIYWKRNEHQRAAEYYQRALDVYEQLQDYWGIIPLQLDRGIEFDRAGEWPQAMECFQAAIDQAQRLGAMHYETLLELAFGIIHTKLGADDLARAHLQQCLQLAREHSDNELIVAGLSSLSDWHIRRSEWNEAEQAISEAEPVALEMDAKDQLPELWRGRVLIQLAREQFDPAREMIKKTIDLCRDLELKIDEGMGWRILGLVFSASGQLDQATDAFAHSLTLLQDDVYEAARSQLAWGKALLGQDHDQATSLLHEARATFERLGAHRDALASET